MMIRITGSAIYCTRNEFRLHLQGINSLVTLGHLNKSDLLFWNTAYSILLEQPEGPVFIPFNQVFDLLVGIPNPDLISRSPLKFSRANRHIKITRFKDAGIIEINPTPQKKLNVFTRGQIYNLATLNLSDKTPKQSSGNVLRTKSTEELSLYENRSDIALIKQIDKIYSFGFATNYLDIVLAPAPNFEQKTIEASIMIKTDDNQFQPLKVKSTCFDDSRLMTPKDKIVAKYYQSAAIQYMWQNTDKFISDDAANRFTFNLKDTLLSTGTSDSGSARWELYMSILRICSNKFELDGTACPEFMQEADFIDENGNTMNRTWYSHLMLVGETDESPTPSSNPGTNLQTRQAPLYVTLAIPDKLYQPTRKALILSAQNKDISAVRPLLFKNYELLKFKETTGYQDTLSDYLKTKAVYGNSMRSKLKRVLSKWLKANVKQPASGVFQFFRSIDECLINYAQKARGTRGQCRYQSCIGYFSEFVFECKVINEGSQKQFANIDYDVVFHHIYPHQAEKIRAYIQTMNHKRLKNADQYIHNLPFEDQQFANWFEHTMSVEGMNEAKTYHNSRQSTANISNDGLMVSPIYTQ